MNIKIQTNISQEFKETEIIINAHDINKELQELITEITKLSNGIKEIIGFKNNQISIINIKNIVCIYSKEKTTFCKTKAGDFKIKQKLYEIEELLSSNGFIRISNSCIVNLDYVECFDVGTIGSMVVKLKDGSIETVSKRKISDIMKFLKKRRDVL